MEVFSKTARYSRVFTNSVYIVAQTVTPNGLKTKKAATGAAFFGLGSRVGEVRPSGIFEESMFRSLRCAPVPREHGHCPHAVHQRAIQLTGRDLSRIARPLRNGLGHKSVFHPARLRPAQALFSDLTRFRAMPRPAVLPLFHPPDGADVRTLRIEC